MQNAKKKKNIYIKIISSASEGLLYVPRLYLGGGMFACIGSGLLIIVRSKVVVIKGILEDAECDA